MTEGFRTWLIEVRGYTEEEVDDMFRAKGWPVKSGPDQ